MKSRVKPINEIRAISPNGDVEYWDGTKWKPLDCNVTISDQDFKRAMLELMAANVKQMTVLNRQIGNL